MKTTWQLVGALLGALCGGLLGMLLGGFHILLALGGVCAGGAIAWAAVGDRPMTRGEEEADLALATRYMAIGGIIASGLAAFGPPAAAVALLIRQPTTGEEEWVWFAFFMALVPGGAFLGLIGLVLGVVAARRGDRLGRAAVWLAVAGLVVACAAVVFALIANSVNA